MKGFFLLGTDMATCAYFMFIKSNSESNSLFTSKSAALASSSSAQMPPRSYWTQVPLSHCVKSPPHIAAVSQDERMTLAADAGVLLFQLGIRLLSLAHFWPLGESPVPARGMLWLTCPVTPALTPAAALHGVLGVCASSRCDCQGIGDWELWRQSIRAGRNACNVWCIFVCLLWGCFDTGHLLILSGALAIPPC